MTLRSNPKKGWDKEIVYLVCRHLLHPEPALLFPGHVTKGFGDFSNYSFIVISIHTHVPMAIWHKLWSGWWLFFINSFDHWQDPCFNESIYTASSLHWVSCQHQGSSTQGEKIPSKRYSLVAHWWPWLPSKWISWPNGRTQIGIKKLNKRRAEELGCEILGSYFFSRI